jgi:hypothetical protein
MVRCASSVMKTWQRAQVVREALAELVAGDLADVAARAPERRHARYRVGYGTTGHLDRRSHRVIELVELVLCDQRHGRLDESQRRVHVVRILGDDVEHRVADSGHGEATGTGFDAK